MSSSYEISWGLFFSIFAGGFIGGMVLIGFGELIERQTETNSLLRKLIKEPIHQLVSTKEEDIEEGKVQVETPEKLDWEIEPEDPTKIYNYFVEKGLEVGHIIATPNDYKYIVMTEGKKYLISMDRGYSNGVIELDLNLYPKVKKWIETNKMIDDKRVTTLYRVVTGTHSMKLYAA